MFSKSLSVVSKAEKVFKIGPNNGAEDVNFEVELGVMLGKDMPAYEPITRESLDDYISGYFLLLDYTDKKYLMHDAKTGGPFFVGKCQDGFLVLSDFIPKSKIKDCHNVWLELQINGEVK